MTVYKPGHAPAQPTIAEQETAGCVSQHQGRRTSWVEISEPHAAHMTVNGECPWCGAFRLVYPGLTSADHVRPNQDITVRLGGRRAPRRRGDGL